MFFENKATSIKYLNLKIPKQVHGPIISKTRKNQILQNQNMPYHLPREIP